MIYCVSKKKINKKINSLEPEGQISILLLVPGASMEGCPKGSPGIGDRTRNWQDNTGMLCEGLE